MTAPHTDSSKPVWVGALVCALFLAGLGFLLLPGGAAPRVVIYTSLDEVYSAPILARFEERTGIRVDVVYDSEASKTVGLANRLVAEKDRPRADVFWNSEILRTLMLREAGVLAPYRSPSAADIPREFVDPEGYWTGYAARARVIVFRTDRTAPGYPPRTLAELAGPGFRNEAGMALPFFGTTSTHVAAMCQVLGRERAFDLLRRLKANGLRVLQGNSAVCDALVRGEIAVGLTDTDDVWMRKEDGKPVDMIYPDAAGAGTLVIPNTIALVRGGPNPEAARKLIDYLLSREVEAALAQAQGRQIPVRDLPVPPGMKNLTQIRALKVDWAALPRVEREIEDELKSLFMD